MVTCVRKQRIEACLESMGHITPALLSGFLQKRYVETGKYRSLPRYKIQRLYDLISYSIWRDLMPGKLSLDIAKRVFPAVVAAMLLGWVAVLEEMRVVYMEVGHVE